MDRIKLLKFLLKAGALYYLMGGITHLFGLTIFPWYVGSLYSPYHDTIIALTAFVITLILLAVSKNPAKNIDVLNALLISGLLGIVLTLYIVLYVDFSPASEAKRAQAIVELVLLVFYLGVIIYLKPKTPRCKT